MPVLHEYNDKRGVYIRTRLDGSPITFQVTQLGEQVLKDMGFREGSKIAWSVLSPLHERGAIYTNKSGVDSSVKRNFEQDLTGLNKKQRERMEAYIASSDVDRNVIHQLKPAIKKLLNLSMTALAERRMSELVLSAHLLQSIRDFNRIWEFDESRFHVEAVETPRADTIAYQLEMDSVEMQCVDKRWADNSSFDFTVETVDPNGTTEEFHINDGALVYMSIEGVEPVADIDDNTESYQSAREKSETLETVTEFFEQVHFCNIREDVTVGDSTNEIKNGAFKYRGLVLEPIRPISDLDKPSLEIVTVNRISKSGNPVVETETQEHILDKGEPGERYLVEHTKQTEWIALAKVVDDPMSGGF